MRVFRSYKSGVAGFTLIEIMVAVAIIGILSTVVTFNLRDSGTQSRDAGRQADLRNLQVALESYKQVNGRYPAQCAAGAGAVGWSGQLGTIYACSNGTREYIQGLAPKYIRTLPVDEKLNGTDSGFVYRTNTAGTVYKIKAHRTVESETVTYLHPLKACDIRVAPNAQGNPNSGLTDPRVRGWCGHTVDSGGNFATPPNCRADEAGQPPRSFPISYALWGGQAPLVISTAAGNVDPYAAEPLLVINGATEALKNNNRNRAIKNTTDVICQ